MEIDFIYTYYLNMELLDSILNLVIPYDKVLKNIVQAFIFVKVCYSKQDGPLA